MRILVHIDVPGLEPAIDFYCSALELCRIIDGDVAELEGASSVIYLLQKPAGSAVVTSSKLERHYSRHWTPVHIDFVVQDISKATERAIQAGAVKESECIEWRGSSCVTFSDPFGHGFCLIEFTDQTYTNVAVD